MDDFNIKRDDLIVEDWTIEWDGYMNILMYQNGYSNMIEKLNNLNENDKVIHQTFVIGLLGRTLNNKLLDKYSVSDYLEGINNLCSIYSMYKKTDKDNFIIKKSWMSVKHKNKFF